MLGRTTPRIARRRRANRLWSAIRHLVLGTFRYGPSFAIEVALCMGALLLFQSLGYAAFGYIGHVKATTIVLGLPLVVISLGAGEARFRLYQRVWSVAGLGDALACAFAVAEAVVLVGVANLFLPETIRPFRLLVPAFALPSAAIAITGFRLMPRLLSRPPSQGNRLLMVLTASPSYAAVRALINHPSVEWTPVGLVTSDSREVGKTVLGVPVLGTPDTLEHWISVARADGVAFVTDSAGIAPVRELIGICNAAEKPIFIVPRPDEWLGRPDHGRLRQLAADDLVGRSQRSMELEAVADAIAGRVVLVTGAAGSIGSELVRLVATLRPSRLVLVDNNESGLFDITEEIRALDPIDCRPVLVSITDSRLLLDVFATERPHIVFHAAAYKHVPMLESHPLQAVVTNVLGTRNVINCAASAGTESFILISTDKAVARHSVMGCTKRLCELMVLTHPSSMRCWAVRFGNVVGSRGSVVPLFERQIEQGGPVTITHPEATRYMMTIREAASLTIATIGLARPGHLYMLNMGEPIKIVALAQSLIRSRGLRPGADIEIVYTGLRAGERLTEDLLAPEEGWRETPSPDVMEVVSPSSLNYQDMEWIATTLERAASEGRADDAIKVLKRSVFESGAGRAADPEVTADRMLVDQPTARWQR